jgi:serine/threonine-protein kinase
MSDPERHRKASNVFNAALELPEAERDTFLATACAGDSDLEREVRSLLQHDVPDSQIGTEPGPQSEPRDMAGRTVGRFRIVSVLGRGGMGIVWKAEDPVLRRFAAIKFLPPHQAKSRVARQRFLREAQAASRLSHPGIATIYDVGEVDSEPYIAMQIFEGRTIRERLKHQAFAPAEAVRITLQAARALQHAHTHGIIHRDVSASNVMLTQDGAVVVLDFGVALRSEDTTRISRTGELVGTIGYIAPEVIRGEDATAQSDIFNLGVVLYEMLTGHRPFLGDSRRDVMNATLELDPEPASRLVPGVTKELDHVVETALARDLTRRYGTAQQFADELESVARTGKLSRYGREASRRPRPQRPGIKGARISRWRLWMLLAVVGVVAYFAIRRW